MAGVSEARTDHRRLPVLAADAVEVPFVIAGMGERVARRTRWVEHSHPTHELLWNEHGASTAMIGARAWTITPTHGLWIPAGVLHTGAAAAGTWYRAAQFSPRSVRAIADVPVTVEITPLLRLLLERLEDAELPAASRAVTEAMVLDVLAPAPTELLLTVPRNPVLGGLVDAVLQHPGDRRALADWAAELGVHPRTVTRALRAETGLGFAQWVATVRAHQAMALLAVGTEVEDVAATTGYGSVSAFGAAFRRVTGRTPGSFRPSL